MVHVIAAYACVELEMETYNNMTSIYRFIPPTSSTYSLLPTTTYSCVCFRLSGQLTKLIQETEINNIISNQLLEILTQCLTLDPDASYQLALLGIHQKLLSILKHDPNNINGNELLSLITSCCLLYDIPFPYPYIGNNHLTTTTTIENNQSINPPILAIEFLNSTPHHNNTILLRPIPITNKVMGKLDRVNATVGFTLWAAAIVLSIYLRNHPTIIKNKQILELGAGLGLPGLTCSKFLQPSLCVLSDFHPAILTNLLFNIQLNNLDSGNNENKTTSTRVECIDWECPSSSSSENTNVFDVIIGTDVVCQPSDCDGLCFMIKRYLAPNGVCYFTLGGRESRWGVDFFAPTLEQAGFQVQIINDVGPIDPRLLAGSPENLACNEEWLTHWVGTGKQFITYQVMNNS
jgi:predicted nicotinamide N-methyase